MLLASLILFNKSTMLTYSDLIKASRLRQQVGELRPGFLREDDSCHEGPASRYPANNPSVGIKKSAGQDSSSTKHAVFYRIVEMDNGEFICKRFEE